MSDITEESTSRFVKISEEGLDLQVHVHDAGEGPAVVMVHGGGPGASGWSNCHRNVGPFVDSGFRVLLIDCPGFGRSDPIVRTEPFDVQNAKAIRGLIRELGIDKTHLVGNSLGGAASMTFALEYPDELDRLVLMGPAGMGTSVFTPLPMEGIKMLGKAFVQPSLEAVNEMLDVFVFDPSHVTAELREGRYEAMMRDGGLHLKNAVESMLSGTPPVRDLSGMLDQIGAKTLATHGVNDRMVPMDHALRVVGGIPDCRLVMFNRCGHWVQWEHAEEFNRMVTDFLSN